MFQVHMIMEMAENTFFSRQWARKNGKKALPKHLLSYLALEKKRQPEVF